ncbi:MAG: tetratricopeptide repeat-containing sensor histidine kinase [Bacteroidota bacterium]
MKKQIYTLLYALHICFSLSAQVSDSSMLHLVEDYLSNPTLPPAKEAEAITNIQQGLDVLQDPALKSKTFLRFVGYFRKEKDWENCFRYIDSSLVYFRLERDTSTVANLFYLKGNLHYHLTDMPKAQTAFEQALLLQLEYAPQKDTALVKLYSNLGVVFRKQGLLDEAATCYKKALQHAHVNPNYYAVVLSNLKNVFMDGGQIDSASIYAQQVYLSYQEQNHIPGIIMGATELAAIYYRLGAFAKSDSLNRLALRLSEQHDLHDYDLSIYNRMARLSFQKEAYDSALYYQRKVFQLPIRIDSSILTKSYAQLGTTLKALGQLDSAQYYYERALSIAQKGKMLATQSEALSALADLANERSNYSTASMYADSALNVAESFSYQQGIVTAHRQLAIAHEGLGNYKKALHHFKELKLLNDATPILESFQTLQELENQEQLEQERQQAASERIRLIKHAATAILLVAIMAGAIFLYFKRREMAFKEALQHELNRSNQSQLLLQEFSSPNVVKALPSPKTLTQLDDILTTTVHQFETSGTSDQIQHTQKKLDLFSSIISHDLKHFMLQIQQQLDQALAGGQTAHVQKALDTVGNLRVFIGQLRQYQKLESTPLKRSSFDFKELIDDVQLQLRSSIEETQTLILMNDSLPMLQADPFLVRQLLINLIENAIKYAQPTIAPIIEIDTLQVKSKTIISIKDNGIGVDENLKDEIFDSFKRGQGADASGYGIGLAIVGQIVKLHGGKIWYASRPGQGTIFYFTLSS